LFDETVRAAALIPFGQLYGNNGANCANKLHTPEYIQLLFTTPNGSAKKWLIQICIVSESHDENVDRFG
jgi:hypothetical protein